MRKNNFSLIELLVVIGILGALATLVLPGFGDASDDAREKVATTEMREIQSAFRRFATDTLFKNSIEKMQDTVNFGLWPLMKEAQPSNITAAVTYTDYDVESGIGRRGPYLRQEGLISITADSANNGQAKNETGTVEIPVIKDPYGGYYRVLCPLLSESDTDSQKKKKLRKMVLICTGPDQTLDTTSNNLDADGSIIAQNDDKALRLMPLATY
jgi:type II secretory pathway pseudopilin PulG